MCVHAVTNCTTAPPTNTMVANAYVCPNKNSLSGDVCSASCKAGYNGGLTATCTAGVWAYTGTCDPNGAWGLPVLPANLCVRASLAEVGPQTSLVPMCMLVNTIYRL